MNIPGFTAEVTLYSSGTSYRSSSFIHTEVGLNVTPQLPIDWPDIPEIRCRANCFSRFSGDPVRLRECLDEC